mmetsp:Transcript_26204/g.82992  ORF Transcript_26204/g.82992 Transcript_26204/m.82992 type:complete len:488 (-) Transcript_26204:169-1632(-)
METPSPPARAASDLMVGGSCLWSPTSTHTCATCWSATRVAGSHACVASSTIIASNRPVDALAAQDAARWLCVGESASRESTPEPTSVQATTSAHASTSARTSSRRAAVLLAPAATRSRSLSSVRCSKETGRSTSLMASRGPMRTTLGLQREPSAASSPACSTRHTTSSVAQLLGAATRSRGKRRAAPAAARVPSEPARPWATAPGIRRGMASLAARVRVAKRAERRATTTRVLPVPGGPCSKRNPPPGAQPAHTASSCTELRRAASARCRPSGRWGRTEPPLLAPPPVARSARPGDGLGCRPIERAFDCAIARSNDDSSASACRRRQPSIQRGAAMCVCRAACIRSAGNMVPSRRSTKGAPTLPPPAEQRPTDTLTQTSPLASASARASHSLRLSPSASPSHASAAHRHSRASSAPMAPRGAGGSSRTSKSTVPAAPVTPSPLTSCDRTTPCHNAAGDASRASDASDAAVSSRRCRESNRRYSAASL